MLQLKIALGLQLLLLSSAKVFIDGGPVAEEGSSVTIQCSYTGGISFSLPNFRINGVDYSSDSLTESLPFYQHHYQPGIGEAYYNLTLPEVQMSHNGTTYQCFFNNGDITSNTVTLIVTDSTPTTSGTAAPTTSGTAAPTSSGTAAPTTSGTAAPDQPRDENVTIAIVNGATVLVGGIVQIQCLYIGDKIAFNLPSFVINNKTIRGANASELETGLPDYEHKYSIAVRERKWAASYILTLKEAKISDNNTVYQCFSEVSKERSERVWSGKVTLTVIDQPLDEKVTIEIVAGGAVLVGGMVRIRCLYIGDRIAFKLPSFVINNKTIRGDTAGELETELPEYEHKYTVAIREGMGAASYTLTLKEAKISDNNTVYQCFSEISKGRNERVWSGKVKLTVTDPTPPQPTGDPLNTCTRGSDVSLWIVIVLPIVCIIVVVVACVVVVISIRIAIKATNESKNAKREKNMFPYVSVSSSQQPGVKIQDEIDSKPNATALAFIDDDYRYVSTTEGGVTRGQMKTFSPAQEEADNEAV